MKEFMYETKPYFLFLLGMAVLFNMSPIIGKVSGILLLIVGGWIWLMRRQYRSWYELSPTKMKRKK